MARRRIEPKQGDVFEIPLGDGNLGYGHVLAWNLVGFYALRSETRLSLDEIVRGDVAFRIFCQTGALRKGEWPILGNALPPPRMNEPTAFWRSPMPDVYWLEEWRPTPCEDEKLVPKAAIAGYENSFMWAEPGAVDRLNRFFRGESHPAVEIG